MGFLDNLAKGVNNFFGGGDPILYQTPQNIQKFMQPVSTTELQKAATYQNLVGNKQDYDYAQMNIDGWNKHLAEHPNLTAEQKEKINADIEGWTRKRDQAAQAAENTRNSAAAIGIDTTDYGSDKTLKEAAQSLRTYKNVGARDFLNLPSLGELEENRYRELIAQGASHSQAHRIVAGERDNMREMLSKRYTDAMTIYGVEPDGTIDPGIGMQLLRGLAKVDPTTANMFYSGFATPEKVFTTNQAQALALLNNDAAMDRTQATIAANAANAAAQRALQRQNLIDTIAAKVYGIDANNATKIKTTQMEQEGENARTEFAQDRQDARNANDNQTRIGIADANNSVRLAIEQAKLEANSEAGKFAQRFRIALEATGDEKKALEMAMNETFTHNGKKSVAQGVDNTFDAIYSMIAQGNDDAAGELLQQLDKDVEANRLDYFKELGGDRAANYLTLRDMFKKYLNESRDSETPDAKKQANDLKNFLADYRSFKRGTNRTDEFTAISQSNAMRRRNGAGGKTATYNDDFTANERVRKLLDGGGNSQPTTNGSRNVYKPGGTGYYGTWNGTPTPYYGTPYR